MNATATRPTHRTRSAIEAEAAIVSEHEGAHTYNGNHATAAMYAARLVELRAEWKATPALTKSWNARNLPTEGTPAVISQMRGYIPNTECHQRLIPCTKPEHGCETVIPGRRFYGGCFGHSVELAVIVERVVHYMDNSIEVECRDAEGKLHRIFAEVPSGDACF